MNPRVESYPSASFQTSAMHTSPVQMPAPQMSQRKPTTGWYFAKNYEEVLADMNSKTNSTFSTTKGKHFEKDKCRLLLKIWEAEFQGFSDKVRITKGDWENLVSMYNRQANRYNYPARSAQLIENKIKNLKYQYKRVKDKMKTTAQGFDKTEPDTEFPYFDVMDRVLGGNEKFDPSFILDPGVEQEQNDENHTPYENSKQKECDPEVLAIKSCTPDSLKKAEAAPFTRYLLLVTRYSLETYSLLNEKSLVTRCITYSSSLQNLLVIIQKLTCYH